MHNLFFLSLSRGRVLAISHKLLCIRLSSLLCCEPRLPRTSGEAVTQGGPLSPPSSSSSPSFSHIWSRGSGGVSSLSISPSLGGASSLPSPISNPFHRGGGGEVHPVFATLPAFLHTITRGCAYAFRACVRKRLLPLARVSFQEIFHFYPSLPSSGKGKNFRFEKIDEGIVFMNRINYIFIKQLIVINSNWTRTLFPRCIRRI